MKNETIVTYYAYKINTLLKTEGVHPNNETRLIKSVSDIIIEFYKKAPSKKPGFELQNQHNKISNWVRAIRNTFQIDIIPEEDNFNIILETEVYFYALEIISYSKTNDRLRISFIRNILIILSNKTIQYHTHTLSPNNKVLLS